jgi:uncharacterized membrane protein YfcA
MNHTTQHTRQDARHDTSYDTSTHTETRRRLAVSLCLAASLLTAVPLLAAPATRPATRPAATSDAQPAARSLEPLSALWNGIVRTLLGPGGGRGAAPADASGSATPVAAVRAADGNDVGPALDPNGAK